MSEPIEISNGRESVKIYSLTIREKPFFQIAYYRAGRRERRNFISLAEARREAKFILAQLASERAQSETTITTAEIESLVAARKALDGINCPLHAAVEIFAQAVRKLCAEADPHSTFMEAVAFYHQHHPKEMVRLPLGELADKFVDSRRRRGLSESYISACEVTVRTFLKSFPRESREFPASEEISNWLERHFHHPVTRNTNLRTLKTFGQWAKKHHFAPIDTFARIEFWKEPASEIEIYNIEELTAILGGMPATMIPHIAIGAFAGLRAAEIRRLDWAEVNLDRGFIIVAADKAKTGARRLVPMQENLKQWLLPHRQESGPISPYAKSYVNEVQRLKGLPHKRNALRHSYISYRLALVPDAPRIALESGNSPEMIFAHYREVVHPDEAQKWFEIKPA